MENPTNEQLAQEQKNRLLNFHEDGQSAHVLREYFGASLDELIVVRNHIADKCKQFDPNQVLKILEILSNERRNDLLFDQTILLGKQMAGVGQMLQEIQDSIDRLRNSMK